VTDQRITLIGKDVTEMKTRLNPFGKVVILGVNGFDETNAVDRNRQIHLKKFDLSLKGHMLRSASHYLAEWNRISKAAVNKGFSFAHLGHALIDAHKQLNYVAAAEVIFVTASNEEVTRLYDMGTRCARMIQAMSKIVNEMDHDCAECNSQDICKDADELARLKDTLAKKNSMQNQGARRDR
jgi:CO dehydrogenase/acetyl-CoA synthase beta subunit